MMMHASGSRQGAPGPPSARSYGKDVGALGVAPHPSSGGPQSQSPAHDQCSALLRGVPAMDILVRYERSWSIQDALDQHAALAEQREVLVEIGKNRLKVR